MSSDNLQKIQKIQKLQRERITVTGQVQGVGFRPFVYRLARELHLVGWVLNESGCVTIEVQGNRDGLEKFSGQLQNSPPPLAGINSLHRSTIEPLEGEDRFEILPSAQGSMADAQITADTATCEDCLREMFDPADPRYRYPFINCTNCGPRYSIVRAVPYDRPNTTMRGFDMCPLCEGQYSDPSDRRFHAQPVACPTCGPRVQLVDSRGELIAGGDDAVESARRMLLDGKILAIKSLGGFQIACRADDEEVVLRLRRRKRRDSKPFAIMAVDLETAEKLCELNEQARKLLTGPIRPIVLAPKRRAERIAPSVALGFDTLGIMLPYTPLHHLLMVEPMAELVMTSGNFSDEPLISENDSAVAQLGKIVDAFLLHDRPIERSVDDSVVQCCDAQRVSVVRRARGYTPQPIRLESVGGKSPTVLAVGGELKNTVCLLSGGLAVVSEHIGDLKAGRTYRHFIKTVEHLEKLFDTKIDIIAADTHPQYLSSEYALGRCQRRIVRVQHHHAHIASCLAENGRYDEVIGLACDGTGLGDDGNIWGCEVLAADLRRYRRLGHLKYLPLIGGDAAARETFRPALAALHETFADDFSQYAQYARYAISDEQLTAAGEMLSKGVNCPLSSALGRWFDAVAWLCGISQRNDFQGQSPMMLESVVENGVDGGYDFTLSDDLEPFTIDLGLMVEGIIRDLRAGASAGVIAAKFHNTVAEFLADSARRARRLTGLNVVALSGGCFVNRYVTGRLISALEAERFEVLVHRTIPCNDGGLALGQAVIAAAQNDGM